MEEVLIKEFLRKNVKGMIDATKKNIELLKNKNEKQIVINESDWKKIVKGYSKLYEVADRLHDNFWKDHNDYKVLGREAEDTKAIISKVDSEKQEAKVKLGEIYKKGFMSGVYFVNDTWQFDYGEQEEYLIRNGEVKKGFSELWDRNIAKEIKKNIKDIK